MKYIVLTQGKCAIVNDADFAWLSQWKWHAVKVRNTHYAMRPKGRNGKILMHREILGLKKGDNKITDHINGNGLDNRRENLHTCSYYENSYNQHTVWGNSRYRGVFWKKKQKRWVASINHKGKHIYIGSYKTEEEAAIARKQKEKELWGKVYSQ